MEFLYGAGSEKDEEGHDMREDRRFTKKSCIIGKGDISMEDFDEALSVCNKSVLFPLCHAPN